MKFATRAIHVGYDHHQHNRAVMPPIYQSSVFVHDTVGEALPFSYARTGTPTRDALETCLASLEGGRFAMAFSSGMAAIDAVLRAVVAPGDEIVAVADLYGGAWRLLTRVLEPAGIKVTFADLSDPGALREVLNPAVKLVWLESPSNPLLKLVDIEALSAIAHEAGVPVAIDNTFATPYLQTPLALGADIVVHSATKYLGGHSDVLLGAAVVNDDALARKIRFIQNSTGAVPGPQDCFLVLRGIKTLALRMERHCDSAQTIARWLASHPGVGAVYYPGLPDHPDHSLAQRQMARFGGIISLRLAEDTRVAAGRFAERLRLFALAESLGGVESLINHSATMSHGSMSEQDKALRGISEGLVRLSVGIEDVADLLEDLGQALA